MYTCSVFWESVAVLLEAPSAGLLLMAREDGSSAVPAVLWGGSQEITSHHCPVLEKPGFRRMWLRATLSQSQWDHVALSAEEWRNVEAFGNGKTKPRGQQLYNLGSVSIADCKWKVRRSKGSDGICWGKNVIHKVILGEIPGFGRRMGSNTASSWVHLLLFKNIRHLCVDYGCRAVRSECTLPKVQSQIERSLLSLRETFPCAALCPVLVL